MDAVNCAAAGEGRPVKADDLGLLDLRAVTGEPDQEVLKFKDDARFEEDDAVFYKDDSIQDFVEDLEQEAPVLNVEEEDPEQEAPVLETKDPEQEAPVLKTKDELDGNEKVCGWSTETGTTVREEQKISQDKKSALSAAKKGLGYFCYGSYGAMKPKF